MMLMATVTHVPRHDVHALYIDTLIFLHLTKELSMRNATTTTAKTHIVLTLCVIEVPHRGDKFDTNMSMVLSEKEICD